MVDPSTDANVPSEPKKKRRSIFGRLSDSLFSKRHFHLKLLSGTTVGVVVIIVLAGAFLLVTLRNHYQESLRTHSIEVIRLSSLIENDIAGLESSDRGYLLSGSEDLLASFQKRRELIKGRADELTAQILDNPNHRKRVIHVQEIVQKWLDTVAIPEIEARRKSAATPNGSSTLGNSLLDQAREALQSLQDEEQIVLNQRMHDQEWATQSAQILDFLPKLDRAVVEMEKEKHGYLLTGENKFVESYKRAVADFYTYNGYLSILVASSPAQAELLAETRANVERWINKC
ncbi:MAG TPA: CHASE3 domain-containing protein, partial [Chthoniobacterales bacterium]|nr:CHASE3 domain-containing protein [Chthoniobacterales bacterium]